LISLVYAYCNITIMKIFCSGIGGIGLSAYAAYQKAAGHTVCGSDSVDSEIISDLRSQDIDISLNQDGSVVTDRFELFVHTLALPEDHPELKKARELGIECITYFQALGRLTDAWKSSRGKDGILIAVCGTHGKSSTTAMAAKVLIDAGLNPSVILGTKTSELNDKNWKRGNGNIFLVEACEYRRSFLNLNPDIILVTNVDGDHFDAFKDMTDYENAFKKFIAKLPADGILIDHNVKLPESPELLVPGKHMKENAKLVMALADILKINNAEKSLSEYSGCWRRSEIKGEFNGILVIDDYAHHPREIKTTLEGIKESYPGRRLICVFQPHTHDRTIKLYDDFLTSFQSADIVIIPNIYDVRGECDSGSIDIDKFVADIQASSNTQVSHGKSLEETSQLLQKEILKSEDVLVTMGAGDVWKTCDMLRAMLS